MKAILTRYIGPTNTKGGRIKADDGDGNTLTIPYDDSLNSSEVHAKAAKALCEKMGWDLNLIGGWGKNGMYWVFESSPIRA